MKEIVIIGAGGFGREVFNYVEDCIAAGADWQIKGFIDDNVNALNSYDYPVKVFSTISDYIPSENDFCLMAIAAPKLKKQIALNFEARGAKFETLIHPSVIIGRNVKIGKGCVFAPRVSLTCDIELGDFITMNLATTVGHDAKVGSYCTTSSHCDITGFCKLGEGVFLGSSVTMRPSAKIGEWASVGLGSAVIMNVKPHTAVHGNPAVKI